MRFHRAVHGSEPVCERVPRHLPKSRALPRSVTGLLSTPTGDVECWGPNTTHGSTLLCEGSDLQEWCGRLRAEIVSQIVMRSTQGSIPRGSTGLVLAQVGKNGNPRSSALMCAKITLQLFQRKMAVPYDRVIGVPSLSQRSRLFACERNLLVDDPRSRNLSQSRG
jgi:hypothetical protein